VWVYRRVGPPPQSAALPAPPDDDLADLLG
jgi:hypothetical protein